MASARIQDEEPLYRLVLSHRSPFHQSVRWFRIGFCARSSSAFGLPFYHDPALYRFPPDADYKFPRTFTDSMFLYDKRNASIHPAKLPKRHCICRVWWKRHWKCQSTSEIIEVIRGRNRGFLPFRTAPTALVWTFILELAEAGIFTAESQTHSPHILLCETVHGKNL